MKTKTEFTDKELAAIALALRALPKDQLVDYLKAECWRTTTIKDAIRGALDDPLEIHRAHRGLVELGWLSTSRMTARKGKVLRVSRVIYKNFEDVAKALPHIVEKGMVRSPKRHEIEKYGKPEGWTDKEYRTAVIALDHEIQHGCTHEVVGKAKA